MFMRFELSVFFGGVSEVYKSLAIKFVKYNFRIGMLIFLLSFAITILDFVLGLNLGLSPR